MNAARTILVTGFEPFGGETVNASWEAAQRLEGWRRGQFAAVARMLALRLRRLGHRIHPGDRDASAGRGVDDRPGCAAAASQRRAVRSQSRQCRRARQSRRAAQGNEDRRRRARTARGDGAGERDSGRNPRGGISGARVDKRRRLCLQPSLLWRVAASQRPWTSDARGLPAPARDARPDAARASTIRLSAAAAADALRAAAAAMVEP